MITISNTNDPLCSPGGIPAASSIIEFRLMSIADYQPCEGWDTVTGETISMSPVTAITDADGEFTVSLWPTSTLSPELLYQIRSRNGLFRTFYAPVVVDCTFEELKASSNPLTAAQLSALQLHLLSGSHLPPGGNANTVLQKISGANYHTRWADAVLSGFMPLTATELLTLASPDGATLYYTTDTHTLNYWDGATFVALNSGNGSNGGGNTSSPIAFTTTGSSFSPVLTVAEGAIIQWTWADDTTSSSATPTKNYGSGATRVNLLHVSPWSALTRINIGYDEGDGGDPAIEHVVDQHISGVTGLAVVAPTLKQWCSSYNNIDTLSFVDFVELDTIECYSSAGLNHVTLTNVPKLARACFESCSLNDLDVSDVPVLADLRATGNGLSSITYGTTGAHQWHVCTMNAFTNQHVYNDMTQWPLLRDFWIRGCNQTGALVVPSSREYLSMWGSGNHYTSADFTGSMTNGTTTSSIDLSGNELTSITITGCVSLTALNLSDNHLNSAAVDGVLSTLNSLGRSGGTVDVSGNATPGPSGLSAAAALIGKSWTVTRDYTDMATPIFNPIAGEYGVTQIVEILCATDGATIYYTTDESTPDEDSDVYTTALTVSATMTIKAIAVSAGHELSNVGSATYAIALPSRIDFTTLGQTMDLLLEAPGATVTWHWADSTTTTGQSTSKNFGSEATRNHYVTIDPPTALTTFGNLGNNAARLSTVSGLGGFPHLHILYFYLHGDLTTINIDGCTELNQLHLAWSSLTSAVYDALIIALAAQGISYSNTWGYGAFYKPPCSATPASADARAVLLGLGWTEPF